MLTAWGRDNSINVQKVLWCREGMVVEYARIDAGLYVAVAVMWLIPDRRIEKVLQR